MSPSLVAGAQPGDLQAAADLASQCRRCDLYRNATQTVFGEGPADALVMLVGEQPGDKEDIVGRPFVGPAGRVLDIALAAAGVDRRRCFVTNAVKHFKNEQRGKRRLHKRPNAQEVEACRWWLGIERALLKPRLIVALGSTAAASLTGNGLSVLQRRGRVEHLTDGTPVLVTVHPSSLLRMRDKEALDQATAAFHQDLRLIVPIIPDAALR